MSMGPPLLRPPFSRPSLSVSTSYAELEGVRPPSFGPGDTDSPTDNGFGSNLRTPQPPDVNESRRRAWGSRRESQGSHADSELSSASTMHGLGPTLSAIRHPTFDNLDSCSPAVRPGMRQTELPPCPAKPRDWNESRKSQGGGHDSQSSVDSPEMLEAIIPRALGQTLDETDAVADLHFDNMQLCSPAGALGGMPNPAPLPPPPPQIAPQQGPGGGGVVHGVGSMGPPPPLRASASFLEANGCCGCGGQSSSSEASSSGDLMMHTAREGAGERRLNSDAFGVERVQRKKQRGLSGLATMRRPDFNDDARRSATDDDEEGGSHGHDGGGSSVQHASSSDSTASFGSTRSDRDLMPPPAPPHGRGDPRGGGGGPPYLSRDQRQNSMVEQKVLFSRAPFGARSDSFSAPAGSNEGFRFDDHFNWQGKLGSGSYSDVYAVSLKRDGNERFAVKCSKKTFRSRNERAEFLREIELANEMPLHPNVVAYYRAWQEAQVFYVQMELCTGGTLRHIMNREGKALMEFNNEHRVWEIILHICRGLHHIHSNCVIHCDLKPENILVSADGAYKIGDLGQAVKTRLWNEQEGDPKYLSRDLLEGRPSPMADIFSFGMLLYEIASGELLPGHGDHWDFLRSGTVPPPSQCSAHLQDLIVTTMSADPNHRPPAAQVLNVTAMAMQERAMQAATRPQPSVPVQPQPIAPQRAPSAELLWSARG